MKRLARYKWLLIIIPYLLAMIGYIQLYFLDPVLSVKYQDVNDLHLILAVFYNSFKIYGLSVSAEIDQMNMWFEAARLAGAFATTSIIMKLILFVYGRIRMWVMVRKPNTLVVHGSDAMKETLLQTLGKTSIAANGEVSFRAKQHVLAFDQDAQAIRYVMEHEKDFLGDGKKIYFLSTHYGASDYAENGVVVSNIATNCARLYWAEHWLRDSAVRKVAIVGFGNYGQRLLEQALLVNVLPWRSSIEYHIYGSDGKDYLAWHPQLTHCLRINQADDKQDSIHFHPGLIPEDWGTLQQLDRIILAMDEVDENLLLLDQLLRMGMNGVIHIRCNEKLLARMQYMPNRQQTNELLQVSAFGDAAQLFSPDVILHGQLIQTARNNHIRYVSNSRADNIRRKYPSCQHFSQCRVQYGTCQGCPHAAATWDDLTPFEKASNIATADHDPIKRILLLEAANRGGIDKCKTDLCRTEHIRWCRFYYLHNWEYADQRDDRRRRHPSLLPFEQLTPSEQEKDWWAYHLILNPSHEEDHA